VYPSIVSGLFLIATLTDRLDTYLRKGNQWIYTDCDAETR
jgi:hypothetical protein